MSALGILLSRLTERAKLPFGFTKEGIKQLQQGEPDGETWAYIQDALSAQEDLELVTQAISDTPKGFPIQREDRNLDGQFVRPAGTMPATLIPWWLAEIAYEEYVNLFGKDQSLERLAERGGFGRWELLALLAPACIHSRTSLRLGLTRGYLELIKWDNAATATRELARGVLEELLQVYQSIGNDEKAAETRKRLAAL
jgi:hypothetical protein